MKTPRLLLLAVVLALAAAACGADGGDPAPTPTPVPVPVESADQAARAAALRSPLLAGIARQDPDMIGNAHAWEATELPGAAGWQIEFRAGWGDCQAGCIDRHTWTYEVARDGTITFVGEEGPELPPEVVEELRAAAAEREQVVGIAGLASAGPVCPVEQPGDPSCAPRAVAFATIVVKDASGAEVTRATTDEAGFFRVSLVPGAYTVEAQPMEGLMGTPASIAATVVDGQEAWVGIAYDTGIR
jgi:hypothetical protein